MNCEVTGKPLPNVTWVYEGIVVSRLNDNRITDLGNGTLIIDPLAEEHDGNYYCYVQQPNLVLKTIKLRVLPAPQGMEGGEFRIGKGRTGRAGGGQWRGERDVGDKKGRNESGGKTE